MTPQKESFRQAEEHTDNWNLWRPPRSSQKLCMRRLPRAFDTSNPLAKTCENMLTRNNKNQISERGVEAPQTAFEKAFYDKSTYSPASIRWLEFTSKALKKRIHHALCGHGGAWCIAGAPVDGYTRTRLPEHVDSIPISRLPVAQMCKMLSEWHKKL